MGEASSPPPHSTTVSPNAPYVFPVSLPNPVCGDNLCSTYSNEVMIKMIEFISVELQCFLCKLRTEIVLTVLSLLCRISTKISVLQVTISHEITSIGISDS